MASELTLRIHRPSSSLPSKSTAACIPLMSFYSEAFLVLVCPETSKGGRLGSPFGRDGGGGRGQRGRGPLRKCTHVGAVCWIKWGRIGRMQTIDSSCRCQVKPSMERVAVASCVSCFSGAKVVLLLIESSVAQISMLRVPRGVSRLSIRTGWKRRMQCLLR